jgi:hypothetical protein
MKNNYILKFTGSAVGVHHRGTRTVMLRMMFAVNE